MLKLNNFILIFLIFLSSFLLSMEKSDINKSIVFKNLMDFTHISVKDVVNIIKNYCEGWQLVKSINEEVKELVFSSCGKYLATTNGSTIKIWDFNPLNKNYINFRNEIPNKTSLKISSLKFSNNNMYMVYLLGILTEAGRTNLINLVNLSNLDLKTIDFRELVKSMSFTQDNKTLVAICCKGDANGVDEKDYNIKYIDIDSDHKQPRWLSILDKYVALSPDCKFIAVTSGQYSIKIINNDETSPIFKETALDIYDDKAKNTFYITTYPYIGQLHFSACGKYLYAHGRIWDIEFEKKTNQDISTPISFTDYNVNNIQNIESLNNKLFFTHESHKCNEPKNIYMYDLLTNRLSWIDIEKELNVEKERITSFTFSPNEKILVAACGKQLKFWQNGFLQLERYDLNISESNMQ